MISFNRWFLVATTLLERRGSMTSAPTAAVRPEGSASQNASAPRSAGSCWWGAAAATPLNARGQSAFASKTKPNAYQACVNLATILQAASVGTARSKGEDPS